jgi:hypothetical protein
MINYIINYMSALIYLLLLGSALGTEQENAGLFAQFPP